MMAGWIPGFAGDFDEKDMHFQARLLLGRPGDHTDLSASSASVGKLTDGRSVDRSRYEILGLR